MEASRHLLRILCLHHSVDIKVEGPYPGLAAAPGRRVSAAIQLLQLQPQLPGGPRDQGGDSSREDSSQVWLVRGRALTDKLYYTAELLAGSVSAMSPEHLGRNAVPAADLGGGPSWHMDGMYG